MAQLSPTEIQYELEHIGQDRAPNIIVTYATCLSLACIAVVLRFVARRTSRAPFQADDLTIFIALLFAAGQIIAGSFTVHFGQGKHVVLLVDPAAYATCVLMVGVLYMVGASLFKFSALLLYHRLFGSSKRFTSLLCVLAAFIFCYSVAGIFILVLRCNPMKKMWNMQVPGSCLNAGLVATILGVCNVVADFATVFIPLPLIWNLRMQRKWKIQLTGIFLLSGFVCACSIYRVTVMNRLSLPDTTWFFTEPDIWSVAENCIGIVSVSLPTMRPIYNLIVRGHHCSSHGTYCIRCEHSRIAGRRSRLRFSTKWPTSAPLSANEGIRNARTSASDIESAHSGDLPVEMVLHAKGSSPAPESIVRSTTTK